MIAGHQLKDDSAHCVGLLGPEPVDQAVQVVVVVRLSGHGNSLRPDLPISVQVQCQDDGMAMWLTADPKENELLGSDPLALLTGMPLVRTEIRLPNS